MKSDSVVLNIRISSSGGIPIYLQVVNQIKYLVAAGRLSPGDEIPPIRTLAEKLLINPNTVARAYRELESVGVLEKHRTSGTFVAEGGSPLATPEKYRILTDRVDALLSDAHQLNVPISDVINLIDQRDAVLKKGNPML